MMVKGTPKGLTHRRCKLPAWVANDDTVRAGSASVWGEGHKARPLYTHHIPPGSQARLACPGPGLCGAGCQTSEGTISKASPKPPPHKWLYNMSVWTCVYDFSGEAIPPTSKGIGFSSSSSNANALAALPKQTCCQSHWVGKCITCCLCTQSRQGGFEQDTTYNAHVWLLAIQQLDPLIHLVLYLTCTRTPGMPL